MQLHSLVDEIISQQLAILLTCTFDAVRTMHVPWILNEYLFSTAATAACRYIEAGIHIEVGLLVTFMSLLCSVILALRPMQSIDCASVSTPAIHQLTCDVVCMHAYVLPCVPPQHYRLTRSQTRSGCPTRT